MTGREMQIAFGRNFEESGQMYTPLQSDVIFSLLNRGQELVVSELFPLFEENTVVTDALRPLVTTTRVETVGDGVQQPSGAYIDSALLPSTYRHLLSSSSVIEFSRGPLTFEISNGKRVATGVSSTRVVANRQAQHDDILRLLQDPFNTTSRKSPLIVTDEVGISVYTDDTFVVSEVIIDYLREPKTISLEAEGSSELPVFLHQQIVDRAFNLYLNDRKAFTG
jgi:hypothetical protein